MVRPDSPAEAETATAAAPPQARVGVTDSMRRHWRLVSGTTVAVVVFSLLLGMSRPAVYTAEARLNVGRLDVSTQAIPGFVSSVQALAATYSRLVDAEDVVKATARATGVPPADIAGSLTASPIADSPLFRLEATAPSAQDAIERANAAAKALAAYVASLNTENPDSERILDQFRTASRALARAESQLESAKRALANNPTAETRAAVNRARVEVDAARLQTTTFSNLYQQSQQGSISANVVTIFNPASVAASDRGSALQRFLFVGVVAGLLISIALATVIENLPHRARRWARARIRLATGKLRR